MQTIDIITAHDILDHRTDIIAVLGDTRIQDKLSVVGKTVHGTLYGDVVLSQLSCALGFGTIGIDPCVQFHAALMAFGNHPLKRIPVWRWGNTLLSCEKTAPGLDLTLVESIALWAHLKDNQVYTIFL